MPGSSGQSTAPWKPSALLYSIRPAPLQVIEIHYPAPATVTKINKQQRKADHSWLPFVGGPQGDLQAPQGGLLGVDGGGEP